MPGVLLTLSGHVYDENCKPVARALLDFFQADSHGKYDRKEIRLHGHQYTGTHGGYLLRTIVPNHYLRRPPHIHVRVQAPYGPVLETQLFFPGKLRAYDMRVAALNAHDRAFRPELTVRLGPRRGNRYAATFDFVIAVTA
jgi:protocatechuate 3,4-dioxygenase beta subunit